MKVTKSTTELYQIRRENKDEDFAWGDVTLTCGAHSVQVMANSDFGSCAYYWCSTGPDPKRFLCSIDIDYAMNKLTSGGAYEPDPDAREIEIKRAIITARRDGRLCYTEAREAWDDMASAVNNLGAGETLLHFLYHHDHFEAVFGDFEGLPSAERMRPDCRGFWDHVWLPLVEYLKAELEAAAA